MRIATTFALLAVLTVGIASAQNTEYVFNPERTGELTDAFPNTVQNGARGLSGPWDLDQDGKLEMLVAQHNSAGGRVHVIENSGLDTWELVYTTAFLDSTNSSSNARYATAGDLDGDGSWEIIYVAGNSYSDANPAYTHGVYVWEHDGVAGSDNYGTSPATIGNYQLLDGAITGGGRAQNMHVMDVDGDGRQEVLVPSDGASAVDIMYVLSVDGTFEPNGAGSGFEVWEIESRNAPRVDGFGGGSPYNLIPADLNGDGLMELTYHTWNDLNFFNATATEADTYVFADTSGGGGWFHAAPSDEVALFGAVTVDIDKDGNDEVFHSNLFTGGITVLDYSDTDNPLDVGPNNVFYDAIDLGAPGGITSGDVDGDGQLELIAGGPGYSPTSYNNGLPSTYIRIAEFTGGSPSDGSNYDIVEVNTGSDVDTTGFNTVFRDSLGVMSKYFVYSQSRSGQTKTAGDPIFPSGIVNFGDADGDGHTEIAVSFQGVDDSLSVIDEVWNVDSLRFDQTVREIVEAPMRAFVRVVSLDGVTVAIEEERLVLPGDYKLFENYPNPFSSETTISFELPLDKSVSVKIYDVTGREVRALINAELMAKGKHSVRWDGKAANGASVASGTYLYALEYGNFRQSKSMVVVK